MELISLVNKHKNKVFKYAIILFSLIVANNVYKKQVSDVEKLKSKNQMEAKKIGVLDEISGLERELGSYKNLLAKKDTGTIINTINNIAKESGLKIVSIRPAQEQRYQGYIKFPFYLMLSTSDYHALGRFISRIESHQDVYIVEAVDIKYSTPQGQAKESVAQRELIVDVAVSNVAFIN